MMQALRLLSSGSLPTLPADLRPKVGVGLLPKAWLRFVVLEKETLGQRLAIWFAKGF